MLLLLNRQRHTVVYRKSTKVPFRDCSRVIKPCCCGVLWYVYTTKYIHTIRHDFVVVNLAHGKVQKVSVLFVAVEQHQYRATCLFVQVVLESAGKETVGNSQHHSSNNSRLLQFLVPELTHPAHGSFVG